MYLKTIKLAGFKSFVEPTVISLKTSRTAVVGPNGCGKSNIIDAVRWVIGESSARKLRGEVLEDVIFNGTDSRKPVGQAMVELHFDNAKKLLAGEYANYNDITIRRELNRDGTSIYLLNGVRCRRKDIVDLFLGTGLGPNNYAIIEQGLISHIVEAKPNELRAYLEEAAGISKYKERRHETENRMQATRNNLQRLEDIRSELFNQLEQLKTQAEIAERYKKLQNKQRSVKAQIQAMQWQTIHNRQNDLTALIATKENELVTLQAELAKTNASLTKNHEQKTASFEQLKTIQNEFYTLDSSITHTEQEISHRKEQLKKANHDLEQITLNQRQITQNITEDRENIEAHSNSLTLAISRLESAKNLLTENKTIFTEAEKAMHNWQLMWENLKNEASQNTKQLEIISTKINHFEQDIKEIEQNLLRLNESKTISDEINTLSTKIQIQEKEYKEAKSLSENLQSTLVNKRNDLIKLREQIKQFNDSINLKRDELQNLQNQNISLEATQKAALNNAEQKLPEWLQKNNLISHPRLIHKLQIDKGWEKAVEIVLNQFLNAICIDNIDNAIQTLTDLDNTNVTLFVNQPQEKFPTQPNSLANKVESELPIYNLLANILTADNLSEALSMRSSLKPHESIITPDGYWLGNVWFLSANKENNKVGLFQREDEISTLSSQINEHKKIIDSYNTELNEANNNLHKLESELDQIQHQSVEAHNKYSNIRSELVTNKTHFEHLELNNRKMAEDIDKNEQKLISSKDQLKALFDSKEELEKTHSLLLKNQEKLASEQNNYQQNLNVAGENFNDSQKKHTELETQITLTKNQIEYLTKNLERATTQSQNIDHQKDITAESITKIEQELPALETKLNETLNQKSEVNSTLETVKKEYETIEYHCQELEKNRNTLHQKERELNPELEKIRIEWQTLEAHQQNHAEKIKENGFDLQQVLTTLPENANTEMLEKRAFNLEKNIEKLGPVNLMADIEYNQKMERKTYLDKQQQDLVDALANLDNAIKTIDQETKERFNNIFTQVNAEFENLFPIVFGGGKASLIMTDNDLLQTGVKLQVQPPGKRNVNIQLLSGGEKALTAITLIFSMFRLNPAPFCMLDEVDAPLDDNNTVKFCNIVKRMSENTQFMFVTHNKLTMEMADQLTGITMQEPGISNTISVNIQEAIEIAGN